MPNSQTIPLIMLYVATIVIVSDHLKAFYDIVMAEKTHPTLYIRNSVRIIHKISRNYVILSNLRHVCGIIFTCIALSGCVSSSLEDAAPLELAQPTVAPSDSQVTKVTVDNQEVEIEDDKTSDNITYQSQNRGAVAQLTEAEKIAIEAKMTELLLRRETNSAIRAKYEARLKYLREIARTQEVRSSTLVSE